MSKLSVIFEIINTGKEQIGDYIFDKIKDQKRSQNKSKFIELYFSNRKILGDKLWDHRYVLRE